ncbi:C45 family peptidase [Paraburkholderia sp.]|uniref:C45 family autoproteolytic acyltransferase/hydolase n=1 Tax=Paraburkholderia sp. TaxID=1926495 RepID=UPI002396E746|nr:C45 family peptidase [Paraburkholderia sp.]MDE1180836.1 C45 family autoproteolytic acyltransferase/hydrolase [Paraburkholderia sp.]
MMIVECTGDGRARGRAHGESARELVRGALDRWADATMRAWHAEKDVPDIDAYAARLLAQTGLFDTASRVLPDLADEVRGIAEGAGLPFERVAAYNLMDEQWWYDLDALSALPTSEPGCSVIGFADAESVVLAQNMDLPAYMDGSQIVLRLRDGDGPESLVLSGAGLIGLTGITAAGVAICVNTLLMLRHDTAGIPVAFALRHALRQRTAHDAFQALQHMTHASGQHYAIADRTGVASIECSAHGGALRAEPRGNALWHTNHPLYSGDVREEAVLQLAASGRIHNSTERLAFLHERATSLHCADDVEALLADPGTPLCMTPRGASISQTFGSVLYRLGDRPEASFCAGRPGEARWQPVPFSAIGEARRAQ